MNFNTAAYVEPKIVSRPGIRGRQIAYEDKIIVRVKAAKFPQGGIDVTDISDEFLVTDLLRRQVRG